MEYSRDHRWASTAVDLGGTIVTAHHRAIISCGPPHMVHEAARVLASGTGLPFIMDMRDPWSLQPRLPESFASPLWYRLARRYETRTTREAALVVTNTAPHAMALRRRYPSIKAPIIAVMNGYDSELVPTAQSRDKFLIVYAGTVYLDRDPRPLFQAAANLVRELHLTADQFGIAFMGNVQEYCGVSLERIAAEEGIAEFVAVHPPRPRQEALAFLAEASVLVSLPQDSVMSIPSKLFEYMQFPAWLLALAEPGSASDLLFQELNADVAAPSDVATLTRLLRKRYDQYLAGVRPEPMTRHPQFSRTAQAAKLFDAIDQVTGLRPAVPPPLTANPLA